MANFPFISNPYPTCDAIPKEWRLHGKTFTFENIPSNYHINMIFSGDSPETIESAQKYLEDNSDLFSHFSHVNFELDTPLFSVQTYVVDCARIVDFFPRKMKIYHSTLWGADVLSDEPVPTEVKVDDELTPYGKFMLDLKARIDTHNAVTGYFIIADGVAYAYPMNECKESMLQSMYDAGEEIVEFYSEPFNY